MAVWTMTTAKHPSLFGLVLNSVARVLFATLLFSAAGMALGLLVGILSTATWGMMHGGNIDMTNAYRHVAVPFAIGVGCSAFLGATYLEIRART
jgi:hypothetical protein